MLNGLDLFSGIGGITLALREWVRPVAYCESEPYAQSVLLSRMSEGRLPTAPIWDDVRTLRGEAFDRIGIDIIYGGFPCQDVSVAGARKGLEGERTGLFREAIRLVRECKPQFVFLENVPGIRRDVFTIRGELEALGYDCRDGFLSAAEVGANHRRNRWWLLAHAKQSKLRKQPGRRSWQSREGASLPGRNGETQSLADTESIGLEASIRVGRSTPERNRSQGQSKFTNTSGGDGWWATEPNVGRVANGVPFRVDRLRGLGNAVCPAQAREAFKILAGIKEKEAA